ncbi:MAG TPA: alpha/beta fold hydrolase [Bdellovibrio sp.]|uniref:alpha/beta fold hydrolase n=1 Tax=Bdellovibrio sp. TaxID=28201 RepID=UPI002EE0057D
MKHRRSVIVLLLALPLPSFAAYTVSGISSGGFMASQMATIYSDQISGVATVAGGVFYCAQNTYQENLAAYGSTGFFQFGFTSEGVLKIVDPFQLSPLTDKTNKKPALEPLPQNPMYQAMTVCMNHPEGTHQPENLKDGGRREMNLDFLKDFENHGAIAPLANIANQRVLIYHGSNDEVVQASMAEKLNQFYSRLGVPSNSIKMVYSSGNHNFPTTRTDGIDCAEAKTPYIANCNLDIAGQILNHLLDRNLIRGEFKEENLYKVTQVNAPRSVASYGYLYANTFCLKNPAACDLHVALHGCKMSDSFDDNFQTAYEAKVQLTHVLSVQDYEFSAHKPQMGAYRFAHDSGYGEYAEPVQNRIMIYFPQTQVTTDNFPGNPKGCWDWYGWTGANYATNQGQESSWLIEQMRKVKSQPKSLIIY